MINKSGSGQPYKKTRILSSGILCALPAGSLDTLGTGVRYMDGGVVAVLLRRHGATPATPTAPIPDIEEGPLQKPFRTKCISVHKFYF